MDEIGFKTITQEEKKKQLQETKRKGIIIRSLRIGKNLLSAIANNLDLALLAIIIIATLLSGYYFCLIYLGMTVEQIKTSAKDFIEFAVTVIVGVFAIIGKLFTAQGEISKSLSKTGETEVIDKKTNMFGNTIIDE